MHLSVLRVAFLLAITIPVLRAQQAAAPMTHEHPMAAPPMLDAELAELFKGITLTESQIRQVTEIKARRHDAIETLQKAAPDKHDPQVKAAVQKHMDAEHGEFTALLTPEQAKTLADNMKSHHAAEGAMRPAMHPAMYPAMRPAMRPAIRHETGHDTGHDSTSPPAANAPKKP